MPTSNQYLARLRRWWYLLTIGMWRGECAIDTFNERRDGTRELWSLGSGKRFEVSKVWWSKRGN